MPVVAVLAKESGHGDGPEGDLKDGLGPIHRISGVGFLTL